MSRFTNMLQLSPTDRKHISRGPIRVMQVQDGLRQDTTGIGTEYHLGVSLKRKIVVSDEMKRQRPDDAFTYAVRTAKRAMVEELFGEFREPLLVALADIDGYELDAAKKQIEGVLSSMFDVR